MSYSSGEKRAGAPSLGGPGPPGANGVSAAPGPSPPSQPRKGTGSRPVLSARPTTASSGGPTTSGPLVASVLGGTYPYHNRNASPGPQRNVSSQQHSSSQRSASASLQRASSNRQRNSHGQVPGKPFFAAYGLQYSGNGRNGSGVGSSTSRSGTMSPYRNRPSSSTGPPSTGTGVMGRPSTSTAQQRVSGENWFGNTKLSVTLPNEAARVVQELGQLLSVFAPPAPSTGPPGPKAPGSFRASKYVSGSGSGSGGAGAAHKEAWGSSGGGSAEMLLAGAGGSALMRPTSAASSTGSASKPIMAPYMGDIRNGQGANLSLMRLQQQQPPQAVYGGPASGAGMLAAAGMGSQTVPPHPPQQQQYSAGPGAGQGGMGSGTGPGTGQYLHSAFLNYQPPVGSSGGGGGVSSPSQPPPRLNLAMLGSGGLGGGSGAVGATNSLPEPGIGSPSPGASPAGSPHGMPSLPPYPQPYPNAQAYPHAPNGPPPIRPWEAGSPGITTQPPYSYMSAQNAAPFSAASASSTLAPPPVSQHLASRSNSSGSSGPYHYLPSVDGLSAAAAAAAVGGSAGYTTVTVAASGTTTSTPSYGQSSSFPASSPPPPLPHAHTVAAPTSLSFTSPISGATGGVPLGAHPPPQPLPVPTSNGPVPVAPSASLAPSPHSAPLHFAIPTTTAGAAGAVVGGAAGSVLYTPAAKAVRDSLMATTSGNSSSGPSPSSSASQVQAGAAGTGLAAAGAGIGFATFPGTSAYSTSAAGSTSAPPLTSFRSTSLANAPHPVGLPPPSPLKVMPPPGSAPGSGRGTFIRSSSSRSSNGSGFDNMPYYSNGTALPTVQDTERDESGSGDGAAPAAAGLPQTPPRPIYGSEDGGLPSASTTAAAGSPSPGFGASNGSVAAGSLSATAAGVVAASSSGHVTWGANVTHVASAPGTPTRTYHTSYTDLTARRVSSSQTGVYELGSSPFARGPDGYSRMLVEHGTLTCVRPSTVPSNFAADSQPDLGNYGELQGPGDPGSGSASQTSAGAVGGGSGSVSVSVSVSMASPSAGPTWTPSSGMVTATSTSAAATSANQPWRRSAETLEQITSSAAASSTAAQQPQQLPLPQQQQQQQQHHYHGSSYSSLHDQQSQQQQQQQLQQQQQQRADAASLYSSAAAAAQAYATAREDGVWGRSRDPTPTRASHGQVSSGNAAATAAATPQPSQYSQYSSYSHRQSTSLEEAASAPPPGSVASPARAAGAAQAVSAPPPSSLAPAPSAPVSGHSMASTTAISAGTGASSGLASAFAMSGLAASAAAASISGPSRYTAGVGSTSTPATTTITSTTTSTTAAVTTTTAAPAPHIGSTTTPTGPTVQHAAATSSAAAPSQELTSVQGAGAGTGVPLPADQPTRPKASATQISPRYSPWTEYGTGNNDRAPPAPTATSTPPAPATPAAAVTSKPPGSATTTTANSAAAAATPAQATGTATSTSSPGAGASSSPAASSAAGSAVSSGSNSSGTASSSAGYGSGGSGGGSANANAGGAGAAGTSSSSSTAAGSLSQHLALRRSGSIVARFNPATVLGSEPDPTFGNLLPGYSVGKVIGEGGFCQVRLAVHHLSQRKVAVKVIDRAKLVDPNEAKRMQREIRVMKHLSHQCVIKLFEVVESPRHLFLVMEHAPAGSLLDYVRARKRLPEADACVFFQQIVASLEYCHSREVVHRDIKLENILLDVDQRMKLIDFGLSAFFVPGKRLRVHCGSPSYAAPEIVARKAYEGPPVDVWSLGVVLFAMVAGYLPFHASGGNKQELCNKIIAGQYTAPDWLSSSMKDLLSRMLTTDPDKRITFPQVWQHSWVRNGPQWHERGVNCYDVSADPSAPGGIRCDEQVVAELEAAGYSRASLVQHLAAGDANHVTASYFLLCESKADTLRRMRGSSSTPRGAHGHSSSSRGSGATSASARSSQVGGSGGGTAAGSTMGSAQLAAAVAKARTAESPGRSSRPSTAAGGGGYVGSARGHRTPHQGEELGMSAAGRMAVAV